MFSKNLRPDGNLWERLTACWFLFRYPHDFIDGVIAAFADYVIEYKTYALGTHTEELSTAANTARDEAING